MKRFKLHFVTVLIISLLAVYIPISPMAELKDFEYPRAESVYDKKELSLFAISRAVFQPGNERKVNFYCYLVNYCVDVSDLDIYLDIINQKGKAIKTKKYSLGDLTNEFHDSCNNHYITFSWDGLDKNERYVKDGTYKLRLRVRGDKAYNTVKIKRRNLGKTEKRLTNEGKYQYKGISFNYPSKWIVKNVLWLGSPYKNGTGCMVELKTFDFRNTGMSDSFIKKEFQTNQKNLINSNGKFNSSKILKVGKDKASLYTMEALSQPYFQYGDREFYTVTVKDYFVLKNRIGYQLLFSHEKGENFDRDISVFTRSASFKDVVKLEEKRCYLSGKVAKIGAISVKAPEKASFICYPKRKLENGNVLLKLIGGNPINSKNTLQGEIKVHTNFVNAHSYLMDIKEVLADYRDINSELTEFQNGDTTIYKLQYKDPYAIFGEDDENLIADCYKVAFEVKGSLYTIDVNSYENEELYKEAFNDIMNSLVIKP